MRLDCPCDLCGKNPRSGRAALAAFRGHARPSPPPVSGPLAGAVPVLWRMALAATHHMLTIDGWRIMGGRDALCPRCQCEGGRP